jgi:hypothetical protein
MRNANLNIDNDGAHPRFGSEREVEQLTGYSRRTLQKHRLLGTGPFPHYKVAGKVVYDIDEVVAIIRAGKSAAPTA